MLNVPVGPILEPKTNRIFRSAERITVTRMRTYTRIVLGFAFALCLMPGLAFASSDEQKPSGSVRIALEAAQIADEPAAETAVETVVSNVQSPFADEVKEGPAATKAVAIAQGSAIAKKSKMLAYDRAAIEAIGSQEQSGHTICCPSYACAYADAVLDGTVRDHDYYSCSCCSWADWGGGDSSDRCVGTDEELLREAYNQILSGKPTVIHVSWEGGEHWIALIGYENVVDPDHLTLGNFIALDPWDGAQLNAGAKYGLYGDGCEHISQR